MADQLSLRLDADQLPAILACSAKLRSLSDLGGAGIASVGPSAGKY